MVVNFYDTSALMLLDELYAGLTIVSPFVLTELEQIKTSKDKDEKQKFQARRATKLLQKSGFKCANASLKTIKKITKKYPFLLNINDHKILCEAIAEKEKFFKDDSFNFLTADLLLSYFGSQIPNLEIRFLEEKKSQTEYFGWKEYCLSDDAFSSIYSKPTENILGAFTNEYCILKENEDVKDIVRWNGEKYCKLNYKTFKSLLGEKIEPRNREQKLYLDLLQNDKIPVKMCLGRFGSGKSMLALAYALNRIQKGDFDKIVFVKNNIEVKDAGRLGLLPGDELDKLKPYYAQIADHVGELQMEDLIAQNRIEPIHLGHIRGRDIKNSILIVDECENISRQHAQLLLGRISENSQIIFIGDKKQCDSFNIEKNSGIIALLEGLVGNSLFGMVNLIKSERSQVAALADLLD